MKQRRILTTLVILIAMTSLSLTCFAKPKSKKIIIKKSPCPVSTNFYAFYAHGSENEGKPDKNGVTFDVVNVPQGNVVVENNSKKTIDAIEVTFQCYDTFGSPVCKIGTNSNVFKGIVQNITLKSTDLDTYSWSLANYSTATKIKNVQITRVHFTDGSVWKK